MWKFLILAALMTSIFVFLYNRGYMVVKSLSAVTFIGSPKGTGAKFTSCSGYFKRIVRFQESGTLSYYLDAELSKGDILVELLDSGKHSIMKLNRENNHASITVESKKKYYLVVNYISATGRYSLIRQ